jgi:uncharacterized repeat protein (TIGR03803 family)
MAASANTKQHRALFLRNVVKTMEVILRHSGSALSRSPRLAIFGLVLAFVITTAVSLGAQSYTVLHTFTGQGDGNQPYSTLVMDRAGNLYGTTSEIGGGAGTVFQLKKSGDNWTLKTLYTFSGTNGQQPYGGVTFGPDGALYGLTYQGGTHSLGTVYRLTPQASLCKSVSCPWVLATLHDFRAQGDGSLPYFVVPFFDTAGNMFGTTANGGINGEGAVFELTGSGGNWTESVIHSFDSFTEGAAPPSGLVADAAGNLYGTLEASPNGFGAVYKLTRSNGWAFSILHQFTSDPDGVQPVGALLLDPAGNLYGTTKSGGGHESGNVYEISPSGSGWTFTMLYSFVGPQDGGPQGPLTIDAAGNLYGTVVSGGANGYGSVFKLMPVQGGWTYTSLHDFTRSDGAAPYGGVILDPSGHIYGTAAYGGQNGQNCSGPGGVGCGVVFEITP